MTYARLVGLPDPGEYDLTARAPLARMWEGGLDDAYDLEQQSPVSQMTWRAWNLGLAPPALHREQFGVSRVYAGGYVLNPTYADDGNCGCAICIVDAYCSAVGRAPSLRFAGRAGELDAEQETREILADPHLLADLREAEEDIVAGRLYEWRHGEEWLVPAEDAWWDM
jgi:hypothetical protein